MLAGEAYRAGQWIGHNYQIIRKLGQGGDGTVYLVRHGPTEQLRAAKLLKNDMVKRRHELDMMKRLRHPALPQVYDVLEVSGELWLIIEFIAGKSLSELREAEELGAGRFFSIARQLADVLVYLHARKPSVLHLDIKPSNIMLRNDGTLTLIDFGAAIHAVSAETGKPFRFGTPGFAAPEQRDPRADLDARADIYGFGAVLYYCLYGTAPGRGKEFLSVRRSKRFIDARKREANQSRLIKNESVFAIWGRTANRQRALKNNAVQRSTVDQRRIPGGRLWKKKADALIWRCLEEKVDRRFPDTLSLYHCVQKLEKRFLLWQQLRKSALAGSFLLAVAIFAAVDFQRDGQGEAKAIEAHRDYDLLLQQAEGLGFAQAAESYKQALALCPEDSAWCEHFLNRIEKDYSFSMEEEGVFKELIFSVPQGRTETEAELLEEHAPDYGWLAYRIGLAYWYFYEGAGGKSAAAKWFEQAVVSQEKSEDPAGKERRTGQAEGKTQEGQGEETEIGAQEGQTETSAQEGQGRQTEIGVQEGQTEIGVQEGQGGQTEIGAQKEQREQREESEPQSEAESPEKHSERWLESARIHARIGSYYEKLGKTDEDGKQIAKISDYWSDLTELWELESLGQEEARIRGEIAHELLSVLIMQGYELNKCGVNLQRMQEVVDSAELFLRENAEPGQELHTCLSQCDAARKAVERLSENERGYEFGTEKEK